MAIESQTGYFSLAEMAEMDTSDIKELMSRIPDEGMFLVRGQDVKGSESQKDDLPPIIRFRIGTEILQAKPLNEDKDPEDYVGRPLSESLSIWPDDQKEGIALIKGRYKRVNLENDGRMGGVESGEPGWLENIVGHMFWIRVRHYTDKNGVERAGFDWFPYEPEGEEDNEAA